MARTELVRRPSGPDWGLLALFALSLVAQIGATAADISGLGNVYPYWGAISSVITALATGGIVSCVFYYVLVYFPERRRKAIIKRNLHATYLWAKRGIAREVIHASLVGGRTDLAGDEDAVDRMMTVAGFREMFDGGKEGHEGFYAFANQMSERTPQYEEILYYLRAVSRSIQVVLDNYEIHTQAEFDYLTGLEQMFTRFEFNGAGYDESKPFIRFVREMFSNWNHVEGQLSSDPILSLIERL